MAGTVAAWTLQGHNSNSITNPEIGKGKFIVTLGQVAALQLVKLALCPQ